MVLSMDRWIDKVAVVTGARSGIGAANAAALVDQGLIVVGLARMKDRIEALAKKLANKKGKLYAVQTDISKKEDILKAFKWIKECLGPVHVLVNSAGIIHFRPFLDDDTAIWRNIFDTNVLGLSIATREAIKDMRENNVDGHIFHINTIKGEGQQKPNFPRLSVYPASRMAVRALAETLRLELI